MGGETTTQAEAAEAAEAATPGGGGRGRSEKKRKKKREEGEKKVGEGNLQHVDFPPGHPRQYSGHSQLLDFQVLMDLGIFNWMWS